MSARTPFSPPPIPKAPSHATRTATCVSALALTMTCVLIASPAGAEEGRLAAEASTRFDDPSAAAQETSGPRYRVGGDWEPMWGSPGPLFSEPGDMTDPDGDGTWTVTLDGIRFSGPYRAFLSVEEDGKPDEVKQVRTSTLAGFPIEFAYTPATGEFVATPQQPGHYDPYVPVVEWVDKDTLAYPKDLVLTPLGDSRLPFIDMGSLVWQYPDTGRFPEFEYSDPEFPHYPGLGVSAPYKELHVSFYAEFTPEQLAAHPELEDYYAIDLYEEYYDHDEDRWRPAPTAHDLATTPLAVVHHSDGNEWLSYTGVYAPGTGPLGIEIGEDGPEPGGGANVILTANNDRANALEFRVDVPEGADVLTGDWDGNGVETLAWRVGNRITFTSSNEDGGGELTSVWYGKSSDEVFAGDWDGDGKDSLGVRRGNAIHLQNSLYSGRTDRVFWYGAPSDILAIGDFDGDGKDTVSMRRGDLLHVNNALRSGDAENTLRHGEAADDFVVGDWDGDGRDSLVMRRGGVYCLADSPKGCDPSALASLGKGTDKGFLGDWDGDGIDTLGVLLR